MHQLKLKLIAREVSVAGAFALGLITAAAAAAAFLSLGFEELAAASASLAVASTKLRLAATWLAVAGGALLALTSPRVLAQLSTTSTLLPHPTQGITAPSSVTTNLVNPRADIDLTVSTDAEDLAAFSADIVEFTQQDASFLFDFCLESSTLAAAGVASFWGGKGVAARLLRR